MDFISEDIASSVQVLLRPLQNFFFMQFFTERWIVEMSRFRTFERVSVSIHLSVSFKKYFIALRSAFVRLRAHLITSSTLSSLQAKSTVSSPQSYYGTVILSAVVYIRWQVLYYAAKNKKYSIF